MKEVLSAVLGGINLQGFIQNDTVFHFFTPQKTEKTVCNLDKIMRLCVPPKESLGFRFEILLQCKITPRIKQDKTTNNSPQDFKIFKTFPANLEKLLLKS